MFKKIIMVLSLGLALSACTTAENTTININTNTMTSTNPISGQVDLFKDYKHAVIKTNLGDIGVAFYEESPQTVNNFLNLVQQGFYNNTKFHRVIKDFMIQGGDPNTKNSDRSLYGQGGPGYKFPDEFNDHPLVRGSLAMANSGPGTNGSQFFIVTAPATPWLDGHHTNFGYVTSGMDVVTKIENLPTYTREDNLNDDQRPQDYPKTEVIIKSIDILK
jgi:cyclophilin family peptidyl-prolyl cis-trans isomerase